MDLFLARSCYLRPFEADEVVKDEPSCGCVGLHRTALRGATARLPAAQTMRPSALALVTLAHAGLPCTHAKTWVVSGGDPATTDKATGRRATWFVVRRAPPHRPARARASCSRLSGCRRAWWRTWRSRGRYVGSTCECELRCRMDVWTHPRRVSCVLRFNCNSLPSYAPRHTPGNVETCIRRLHRRRISFGRLIAVEHWRDSCHHSAHATRQLCQTALINHCS
jgi:hypothetical protein